LLLLAEVVVVEPPVVPVAALAATDPQYKESRLAVEVQQKHRSHSVSQLRTR
jgi:hypothetical protein